jgi:hypothetical protein
VPDHALFPGFRALRITIHDLPGGADKSRSFFCLPLKDRLRNEGGMRVEEVDSAEAINARLQDGRAHLGLIIPADFSERVVDGKQTTFKLLVDGTMPTVALAALYGARVLTSPEATKSLILDDPDSVAAPPRPAPIKIEETVLYNPKMRDSDFFLPGTIGIVVMLVSLTVTTTGLVREKEQQTIEQLWATPLTRLALVGGKILPCGIIPRRAVVGSRPALALVVRPVAALAVLEPAFILRTARPRDVLCTRLRQLQASFLNIIFIISPSHVGPPYL